MSKYQPSCIACSSLLVRIKESYIHYLTAFFKGNAMTKINLYVDGENFYSLTEKYFKENLTPTGDMKSLGRVAGGECYHWPEAKFFWDDTVFFKSLNVGGMPISFQNVDRAYYFTAYHGAPIGLHNSKKYIRDRGFEPHVVHELKDMASQRQNMLVSNSLITKAKGVDIALTVQMLEDAQNYDICKIG